MQEKKKNITVITVVAAVIIENGKILCLQRNKNKYDYISYKYEFPGGKIESGETSEEAIIREIGEELKIDLGQAKNEFLMTVNHAYPDFNITMYTFKCNVLSREFTMTEHIDFKWLKIDKLNTLDWAAADLPIVEKLMRESYE